jgi:hypothetical protein
MPTRCPEGTELLTCTVVVGIEHGKEGADDEDVGIVGKTSHLDGRWRRSQMVFRRLEVLEIRRTRRACALLYLYYLTVRASYGLAVLPAVQNSNSPTAPNPQQLHPTPSNAADRRGPLPRSPASRTSFPCWRL